MGILIVLMRMNFDQQMPIMHITSSVNENTLVYVKQTNKQSLIILA